MTKAGCGRCDGTGWVCEKHPFRPWGPDSKRLDACDCGAGAPCPICNTPDEVSPPDVSKVITEIDVHADDIEDGTGLPLRKSEQKPKLN